MVTVENLWYAIISNKEKPIVCELHGALYSMGEVVSYAVRVVGKRRLCSVALVIPHDPALRTDVGGVLKNLEYVMQFTDAKHVASRIFSSHAVWELHRITTEKRVVLEFAPSSQWMIF